MEVELQNEILFLWPTNDILSVYTMKQGFPALLYPWIPWQSYEDEGSVEFMCVVVGAESLHF